MTDEEVGVGLGCQVQEFPDTWPYIAKCSNEATFVVKPFVRQNNTQIKAEYICFIHAELLQEQYGDDCVEKL